VTTAIEPVSPLGPDPRLASSMAYLAWWVSGGVVWLIERDRPAVRFHAMQSMLAFGTTFLAWAVLWGGSFAVLVISASGFFLLQRLAQFVLLAGFIVWAVCLWQVSRGVDFRLPFFGALAERLSTHANHRDTEITENAPSDSLDSRVP
jgi:uncharacterized membrane protein